MTTPSTCLTEDSLDDLLRAAIEAVKKHGECVEPTKGPNRELRGVTLRLTNPRARLSRSESRGILISALGELLWYLSGSGETAFIKHYIRLYETLDEDGIVFGAYGPRLRGQDDQLFRVIERLRETPSTRKAVIQLFDADDLLAPHKDVPCTCTLQFFRRNEKLDLVVYMRSNDVFIGLPHDVFCFTMIQELVASSIGIELGDYVHMAGSLHLYDANLQSADEFLEEGYHWSTPMPAMPAESAIAAVGELLTLEECLRMGGDPRSTSLPSNEYWADLGRLLVVFALDRRGRRAEIAAITQAMASNVYKLYVEDRLDRKTPIQ